MQVFVKIRRSDSPFLDEFKPIYVATIPESYLDRPHLLVKLEGIRVPGIRREDKDLDLDHEVLVPPLTGHCNVIWLWFNVRSGLSQG